MGEGVEFSEDRVAVGENQNFLEMMVVMDVAYTTT
jgi:hypothetical protein